MGSLTGSVKFLLHETGYLHRRGLVYPPRPDLMVRLKFDANFGGALAPASGIAVRQQRETVGLVDELGELSDLDCAGGSGQRLARRSRGCARCSVRGERSCADSSDADLKQFMDVVAWPFADDRYHKATEESVVLASKETTISTDPNAIATGVPNSSDECVFSNQSATESPEPPISGSQPNVMAFGDEFGLISGLEPVE